MCLFYYNMQHEGYWCLDCRTDQVYIFRHVHFNNPFSVVIRYYPIPRMDFCSSNFISTFASNVSSFNVSYFGVSSFINLSSFDIFSDTSAYGGYRHQDDTRQPLIHIAGTNWYPLSRALLAQGCWWIYLLHLSCSCSWMTSNNDQWVYCLAEE